MAKNILDPILVHMAQIRVAKFVFQKFGSVSE